MADLPDNAVLLRDIERTTSTLFRALGRDPVLRVAAGRADLGAWRDDELLCLPQWLATFDDMALNRELYLWFVALATAFEPPADGDWAAANTAAIARITHDRPGTAARRARLRDDADETEREDRRRRAANLTHTVKMNKPASVTEFIHVTREDSGDNDEVALPPTTGAEGSSAGARVRFDVDTPSGPHDDIEIGAGIPADEWDYRKRVLLPGHCMVQEFLGRSAGGESLPVRLHKHAHKLRRQFAALVPQRQWIRGQPDGAEPDLDAYVRLHADRIAGGHNREQNLYIAQRNRERDLSCMVLADLSLSTEARVSPSQCVIDVIRDSLMLFAEALTATGDRFGMYGFSSQTRAQVRFHRLKDFNAGWDDAARGRVAGLKPGFYTRIGPALRHATRILERQDTSLRVLLVLTDGKPHDIDYYEERYGIEDTRMAVLEARRKRIKPFCITIDREGSSYLPHLFGVNGYTVLRRPEDLTARLPMLYAQLTGQN
jgi:nitric oxide reductase NorD protein